jgi:exosortase
MMKAITCNSEIVLNGDGQAFNHQSLKAMFLWFLLLAVYSPMLIELIQTWNNKPQSSHGFFVIPLSLWFCWQRKELAKKVMTGGSSSGTILLLIGLMIYMVGFLGRIATITNFSFMVSLSGIIISVMGYPVFKIFLFPYLFLLFMFPIPDAIYLWMTNPLKLLASDTSAALLKLFGIAVYQDGNLIQLAGFQMEVVEACSGMRSVVTYLMLGIILASFVRGSNWKKILLTFITLPIALFNNILRITVTGLLAEWYSVESAEGFFHGFTGLITFAIGFLLLLGVYKLITGRMFVTISNKSN